MLWTMPRVVCAKRIMSRILYHPVTYFTSRFPDRLEAIRVECERSESFRTLCEDLRLCTEALSRWRESDTPAAAERLAEYTEWEMELEQEIEQWLDRLHSGAA
jgi:hypothetical protein